LAHIFSLSKVVVSILCLQMITYDKICIGSRLFPSIPTTIFLHDTPFKALCDYVPRMCSVTLLHRHGTQLLFNVFKIKKFYHNKSALKNELDHQTKKGSVHTLPPKTYAR